MPCNSEHMNPQALEIETSRVACFLDELDGKKWTRDDFRGYHPTVYGKPIGTARRDKMVATLCDRLKHTDVTKQSLELQIWWRDHQEIDKARLEREQKAAEEASRKDQLLLKYFDEEDMCWYYGGMHTAKGFHWCEDMRHSTLFNRDQIKTIREKLAERDEEIDFQVWQRVE
jgi:hypothetical protein